MDTVTSSFRNVTLKFVALIALALTISIFTYSAHARQNTQSQIRNHKYGDATARAEFVSSNNIQALLPDGQPFFIHAAAFDYFSIPRDLWEHSLDSYKDLGFNAIALRIPWNWHEPQQGEFDFDGHTNPRRDLRSLLRLIAGKGLKLILSPGPELDLDWPNNGTPAWLPPGAESYLRYSQLWVGNVARELIPYVQSTSSDEKAAPNPLFCVVLELPVEIRSPQLDIDWHFAALLKQSMVDAGLDARYVVTATGIDEAVARPPVPNEFSVAGRWELNGNSLLPIRTQRGGSGSTPQSAAIISRGDDAESLSLLAQSLRESQMSLALISDFGFQLPPGYLPTADPNLDGDRFLDWCLLVSQGVRGIVQFNVQNTIPPAGYLVNGRRENAYPLAAVDFSGDPLPHPEGIRRERDLISRLGPFLARAHPRTVLGIVDLRSGSSLEDAISGETHRLAAGIFSRSLRQIERVAALADIPAELADPNGASSNSLASAPVLLLAVPEELRGKQFLTPSAQNALLEYVRRGGSLICDPELPAGDQFAEALQSAKSAPAGDGVTVSTLNHGRIIVWTKLFYDWVKPEETPAESRGRLESAWTVEHLQELIKQQSVSIPVVREDPSRDGFLLSQLIPTSEATAGGASQIQACDVAIQCIGGILSVANWGDFELQQTLKILPPSVQEKAASPEDYVELPITLRAKDAMFLPLDVSLCSTAKAYEKCRDRIVAAGAELVSVAREGKSLELTFYAPSKATIVLHLAAAPHHLELPERTLEGKYVVDTQIFTLDLPRGAAPDFLRTVKLAMPYTPFVAEPPKPEHTKSHAYRYSIANAIRLPLGEGASILTSPPLLLLGPDLSGRVLLHVQNLGDSLLTLHVEVSGAVSASRTLRLEPKERNDYALDVRGGSWAKPDADGLLHAAIHIAGGDQDSGMPLEFVIEDPKNAVQYRADFDRDGFPDWVLENDRLRVIVSPASGGRVIGLFDKDTRLDLLAAAGGMHDLLPAAADSLSVDAFSNSLHDANWETKSGENSIQLESPASDASPSGFQIRKSLRLLDSRTLQVEYALPPSTQTASSESSASLVSEFSFPAFSGGTTGTQFCWTAQNSSGDPSGTAQCEPYVPGAQPLHIPKDVAAVEIRTLNRVTIFLAWNTGNVTIRQENSDVRFLWEMPFATPENASSSPTLKLTVGESH